MFSADSAVLGENQAHRQVPLGPREGDLEVPLEEWSRQLEGFSLTAIGPATWRHGSQRVEASSCWESTA